MFKKIVKIIVIGAIVTPAAMYVAKKIRDNAKSENTVEYISDATGVYEED